jgi:hypothetical protein
VGLVVYVRNDPVNKVDPDGRDWVMLNLGNGFWRPAWQIPGETFTVTAEPEEVDTVPELPPLFGDMAFEADVDPSATGNGKDHADFSGSAPPPKPKCWRDVTPEEGMALMESARAFIGQPLDYNQAKGRRAGEINPDLGNQSFDCSGFVCTIAGIDVTNTPGLIVQNIRLRTIDPADARSGDIVFFNNTGRDRHVGFFESPNRVISMTRKGVRDLTFKQMYSGNGDPTGFRRLQVEGECAKD